MRVAVFGWLPYILLSSILGCSSPHRNDTLIVAADSSPTNLDPRIGIDKASEDFHHLLFNGLLRKDERDRMVPDLARSFEKISPVLYRFQLRPGIHFHNGNLLTAQDVIFTYNSILSGAINTVKKANLEAITAVTSPEPNVIEIHLREPFNGLLSNLNIGIIPENSPDDFAQHPVGTGPYRFISYEHDEEARFERFDEYFDGPPKIRYLQIRILPDATTRALELKKGSADLALGPGILPPDYFRMFLNNPDVQTMSSPGENYAYLGLNLRDPILKNRQVRQAIGYAINRRRMLRDLFSGAASLATGLLLPTHWAYESNVLQLSYDIAKARKLLDEAGYPDPDGDGPQMRFRLTYKVSTVEFRRVVATVIQQDLARVGIGIDIRAYEWGTFFADVNHGNFQVCMLMWVGESDPDIYRNVFTTDAPKNRGKYSDPDVDRWLQLASTAPTDEEEKYFYSLVQKKLSEDCPYISLWYENNIAVFHKGLRGLVLTPNADYRALKNVYWATAR